MNIKKKIFPLVKIISTLLITGALGLELWNIYAVMNEVEVPSYLHPIFCLERFAVIAHFIEGVIALVYAPSKGKIPLKYGTYTFFVGTIGLLELFDDMNRE
ncbi:hypothetical protein [Aetokthonos hydrillicola]|uniref:hypothetical protein n=1 Tax=Aetokthonos hydrillicola TaxID=1550245 RepID=UPI001B1B10C2|nr:hypothetical protein [Aetokthonos hydrillicola CCALA 1050]